MEYELMESTPISLRIWVTNPSPQVKTFFNTISIWGGADSKGSNYLSWEISSEFVSSDRLQWLCDRLGLDYNRNLELKG